jgi:hypothetical protein
LKLLFQVIKDLAKELFREVIYEVALSIAQPLTRAIRFYLDQDKPLTEKIIADVVDPQSKYVFSCSLLEEQLMCKLP